MVETAYKINIEVNGKPKIEDAKKATDALKESIEDVNSTNIDTMNQGFNALSASIRAAYSTMNLFGEGQSQVVLQNIAALQQQNEGINQLAEAMKPSSALMQGLGKMNGQGNKFAGILMKAGGAIGKFIPQIRAISFAKTIADMTGLTDKMKELVTQSNIWKNIMESVNPQINQIEYGNMGYASKYTSQTTEKANMYRRLLSKGMTKDTFMQNVAKADEEWVLKMFESEIAQSEKVANLKNEYAKQQAYSQSELKEFHGSKSNYAKVHLTNYNESLKKEDEISKNLTIASSQLSNMAGLVEEKSKTSTKKDTKSKTTSTVSKPERITNSAPSTFNVYISELGTIENCSISNAEDEKAAIQSIQTALQRMLMQLQIQNS